ncbi:MAG: NERD domain-containing protein [Deltaproteobacteria bacterium]|nr:NERD domain-containing protein [Deltaproteobacteria bacterium]
MSPNAPRLFPVDAPRPTTSEAERKLWSALKQKLPAGWRAWHSLRLRSRDGHYEGEGDFVFAVPDRGLLVLEIKGGAVEMRGGHWRQNGQEMKKAPRAQVQQFVRNLADELKARTGDLVPFGTACAFPDCDFSAGPESGDLDGLVLGQRDLAWLDTALIALAERGIPRGRLPAGAKWMGTLHALWGDTWVPTVSLQDRAQDAEARLVSLNEEQLRVLDAAEEMPRAVVTGGAGTGKTLLALELCRRKARAGKRVLYLCFTDALARQVDAALAAEFSLPDRPRALTIRRHAVSLLSNAGLPTAADGPRFWAEVSLQAACDALPPPGDAPGFVAVDEGQDFEGSDWELVLALSQDRELWVFHDPLQAFWADRPLPPALAQWPGRLKLPRQERCPEPVARFATLYQPGASLPASVPVEEATPRLSVAPAGKVPERVRHMVDDLIRRGASPADIAVVTLGGQTRSNLFDQTTLGSHRLVHADAPEAASHVVLDTFLRFKGLERPWIVLAELEEGAHRYEARMRMAVTRATAGLTVVCTEEMLARDPRLALLPRA